MGVKEKERERETKSCPIIYYSVDRSFFTLKDDGPLEADPVVILPAPLDTLETDPLPFSTFDDDEEFELFELLFPLLAVPFWLLLPPAPPPPPPVADPLFELELETADAGGECRESSPRMVDISPCMNAHGTDDPINGHFSPDGQYTSHVVPLLFGMVACDFCCALIDPREHGKQNLCVVTDGHCTKWVSSNRS